MLNLKKDNVSEDEQKSLIQSMVESEAFNFITNNFTTVIIGLLFLQSNILVGQLFFKKSSLILCVLISVVSMMILMLGKDNAKDTSKKFITSCFKCMLALCVMLILNHLIIDFISTITKGNTNVSFLNILYMLDFGIIVGSIGINAQEGVQDFLTKLLEYNYSSSIAGTDKDEIKPGDAVLGFKKIDGEITEEPVVLPLKDRFLHMLILGPTGCGKTSQSIIPMINRDMQNNDLGIIALEPKGDLAEKVFAMAEYYHRACIYFNPILPDCPYFNPFFGKESDVVENLATTFIMLNPDAPQFFKDMCENLIRKSTKLLKRLYHDDATIIDLNTLVWDTGGQGRKMVMEFSRTKHPNPDIQKENEEIYQWFLNDYYSGASGGKGGTKTYEHCSGVRSQISKLVSNEYLRKVLNPPKGHGSDLDFDKALAEGLIVCISTAQGALRDLGRFLGYFIILQLQSSVFRRPGNEFTRRACMLYIDEFQVYSNPGFADMLTMGRSYRVASHLATQAREQIGMGSGKDGKSFVQLVSTNARNKIIYPGISSADAKYYSEEFGEQKVIKEGKTYAKKRFFSTLGEERVSTSVKEETEKRFSITDLIYKEFGEITYCIVKKNTVQYAGVSKIQYIPMELNNKLDEMIEEYNNAQKKKSDAVEELMNQCLDRDNLNLDGKADLNKYSDNIVINNSSAQGNLVDPISTVQQQLNTTSNQNDDSSVVGEPIVDRYSYSNDDDDMFVDDTSIEIPKVDDSLFDDVGADVNMNEEFEEYDDLI